MTDLETIAYESPAQKVARIVLNRPETRNAQSYRLLYELNAAFDMAARDDDISVIILAANGPDFSSGHDLRDKSARQAFDDFDPVGTWCGFGCPGAEGRMAIEEELYLGLSERWRNVPKPTIAEVQGRAVAGALQLIWPCDLIVASDATTFRINPAEMGVCCAEFFQEPWELGIRKAKEILFTGDIFTAADAQRWGMVNHVVPAEELTAFTLDLATRIARHQLFALKLAKKAVNNAQDQQGRANAMQTGFAYHQLCHSHNQEIFGLPIDPTYLQETFGSSRPWK
jgi:enoyl-CoA hydratase